MFFCDHSVLVSAALSLEADRLAVFSHCLRSVPYGLYSYHGEQPGIHRSCS